MTDQPRRTGGAHSTTADFADLRATGGVLDRAADSIRRSAGRVAGALVNLPATAFPFAPVQAGELAADELWLIHSPHGLIATGLDLEVIARGLYFAATAYAGADATAERLLAAGRAVGAPVRVGKTVAGSAISATSITLNEAMRQLVQPQRPGESRGSHSRAWVAAFTGSLRDDLIAEPGLTEDTITTVRLLTGPPPFALTSDTLAGQAAQTAFAARAFKLLRDERPLTVTPARTYGSAARAAPRDVGDLLDSVNSIENPKAGGDSSRIRVRHVVATDGRAGWVVEIPGTQDWSPSMPSNPSDSAANLAAVAGLPVSLYPAIEQALRRSMAKAGVRPGAQPVLLVGHSQGGIVATRMAADKKFRRTFGVTRVVTAGSPVSHIAVPGSVKTLDLAHTRDPVPRLDQRGGPNALNRFGFTGDPTAKPADRTNPIAVHGADRYAASARSWAPRGSADPDVRDFYDGPFFDGSSNTVDDYLLKRPPK